MYFQLHGRSAPPTCCIVQGSNCISNLCLLSFGLRYPGWRLVNFIDLFKDSALSFIDFLYCPPVFNFIYFCSKFYYVFSFTCLKVCVVIFLQFLKVETQITDFISIFFSNTYILCYKLTSKHYFCCSSFLLTQSILNFLETFF